MAKKDNINNSALSKLCSYIALASQQGQLINDTLQAQDKVFSSKHVTDLINSMSEQDRKYANDIVANLNKLSSKTTNVIPNSSNAEPNTLYLYSADPNPTSYNQYMVLSDKTILDLGTTNISLEGYLKETDADNKYLKQVDSHSHNNKLILDTITQDKIDEWDKGGDGLIPVTKAQHEELVTNGSATINGKVVTYDAEAFYVIIDDENSTVDMSKYLTTADKVNMGVIDEGVSLNDLPVSINKASIYYAPTYASDMPLVADGMVIHMNILSAQHAVQQYNSLNTNEVYTRTKVFDTWSGWRKLSATSVADVPVTYINTFEDETYVKPITTNVCSYYVTNGFCVVKLETLCLSTTASFVQIISGLPKPKGVLYSNVIDRSMGSNSGAKGLFQLVYDGTLRVACDYGDSSVTMNRSFYATFSYPVAES